MTGQDGTEDHDAPDVADVERDLAELRRALYGTRPPGPGTVVARLEGALKGLERPQWEQALRAFAKKSPFGYYAAWHHSNVDDALGKRLGFRGWNDSRVNYTGDARTYLASRAVAAIAESDPKRAIALYYPFVDLIPLGSVGIAGPLEEMADPEKRAHAIVALEASLERFKGRRAIPESAVPTSVESVQTAICYAALDGVSDRNKLREGLVALAAVIPDAEVELVERRADNGESVHPLDVRHADDMLDAIRAREQMLFDWLVAGEGVRTPKLSAPIAFGKGEVEGLASTAGASQWIYGFAYLYGLLGLFVALGACQTKQSTLFGLLAFTVAFAAAYVPLGAMFGFDALQKRRGTQPANGFLRWGVVFGAIVATPLIWVASFILLPSD